MSGASDDGLLGAPPPGSLLYNFTLWGQGGTLKGQFAVSAALFAGPGPLQAAYWRGANPPGAVTWFALQAEGQNLTLANCAQGLGGISFIGGKSVAWICNTPGAPPPVPQVVPPAGGPATMEFAAGSKTLTLSLFYASNTQFNDPRLGWSISDGFNTTSGLDILITSAAG